jgi:hypothetical protein
MSGAYLSPSNKVDARDRHTQRSWDEYHEAAAKSCYRWGTLILVVTMAVIASPKLGVSEWNWYIAGAAALAMTILAFRMKHHGYVGDAIACLICAFVVLPGWIYFGEDVVKVAIEFYKMVKAQWNERLG